MDKEKNKLPKKETKKKESQSEDLKPTVPVSPPSSGSVRRYGRRMGDVGGESKTVVWMITFTDVMGLLLTFFVMMFAMAEPTPQKWEEVSSSLNDQFSRIYGATFTRGPVEDINLGKIDYDRALDINYLNNILGAVMDGNENLKDARLIRQPGRLIISLPQDLLFQPGDAAITDAGSRAMYALGGTLSRIKNKIQIVGHADPHPVRGGEKAAFESNWDLSLARAASVAGLLNSVGYGQSIDIVGSASGRYEDLSAVQDDAKRLELARRVDIILLNYDGRN